MASEFPRQGDLVGLSLSFPLSTGDALIGHPPRGWGKERENPPAKRKKLNYKKEFKKSCFTESRICSC
jgi:hypothetical protein